MLAMVGVLTPQKLADATVSPEPDFRHSPGHHCSPPLSGTFTQRKSRKVEDGSVLKTIGPDLGLEMTSAVMSHPGRAARREEEQSEGER